MMRWLVSNSLRQPVLVLALACALLVLGYRTLGHMPMDVFPEFAPPLVEIQTEAPGLSAEEVEALVTVPLENALNGTSWLDTIRSKSVQGLSSVRLIFQDGTDLMRARQLVGERLAVEAPRLPVVASPPVILSPLSSTSRVLKIGMSSESLSQMDMTVTPALGILLLPGKVDSRGQSPSVALLKRPYRWILPVLAGRPALSVILLVLACALPVAVLPMLGEAFLPKFKETDFLMHWVEKPGTSLSAMQRISQRAGRELLSIEGVRNFGTHTGRAEVADEVVGPNFTELWISLDESVDYDKTVARVQETVDGYPGLYRDLLTYLSERIKEVLSGTSASIVVRIFGPELATLRAKAHEVEEAIADVAGVTNLKVEAQVLVPQIEVRLRADAAERFGLTPGQVRRAATTLIKGTKVGEVYSEQKIFEVAVWGAPAIRNDLTALRDLMIETPSGGHVPMGEVADVRIVATPNSIQRESASRRIDVTCNVLEGYDLGSVAGEIQQSVLALPFEREYHPEFLGEYAARIESRNRIAAVGLLALVGIAVLLYTDFHSTRLVLLVLLSLPFALLGGVAGAWLGGGAISLGSLVGFVTVLGVSVRNGIMLISHYQHLENEEGMPFGMPLVLRGAEERLAPILMTALTTTLGLVPLVVAGNIPGHEIEYPMAMVIVGGLLSSTILNLLLMPGLYWVFGRGTLTK